MRSKNVICMIFIVFLFTCCSERHSNKVEKPRSDLENIIECKYLRQYFEDNTNGGKFYVDSIYILHYIYIN